jgi:hypothetical protein
LDFCLFDCCHLSLRLGIQWRRWDSTSLVHLDAIVYLKKERSLEERKDEPREARESRNRQFLVCVHL